MHTIPCDIKLCADQCLLHINFKCKLTAKHLLSVWQRLDRKGNWSKAYINSPTSKCSALSDFGYISVLMCWKLRRRGLDSSSVPFRFLCFPPVQSLMTKVSFLHAWSEVYLILFCLISFFCPQEDFDPIDQDVLRGSTTNKLAIFSFLAINLCEQHLNNEGKRWMALH